MKFNVVTLKKSNEKALCTIRKVEVRFLPSDSIHFASKAQSRVRISPAQHSTLDATFSKSNSISGAVRALHPVLGLIPN